MGCTENPLAIDNHPTAFMFVAISTYKGSVMLHLLLMVLQMGYWGNRQVFFTNADDKALVLKLNGNNFFAFSKLCPTAI